MEYYTQQMGDKKALPRVKCMKCGRIGNLTIKKTKTRGVTYEYYYIQHYIKETDKIEWCYLGPYEKLSEEYKKTLQEESKYTQHYTQNVRESDKPKSFFSNQTNQESLRAGSSAWYERLTCTQEDVGSNPARSTIYPFFYLHFD